MKRQSNYRAPIIPDITVPAWAGEITVARRDGKLVVKGTGRVENLAVAPQELTSTSQNLLGRYIPTVEWGKKQSAPPPHIRFARATDIEEQIAFVRDFGPLWGKVVRHQETVVVEQNIKALKKEQKTFQLAMLVMAELGKGRDSDLKHLMVLTWDLGAAIGTMAFVESGYEAMLDAARRKASPPEIDYDISTQYCAHWILGTLLDLFPPSLIYFDGKAAELPLHSPKGILPMLYFMMRKDYLARETRVATCANVNCNKIFAMHRRGQHFCSDQCSALQRGREFWHKKGKKLRRARRER